MKGFLSCVCIALASAGAWAGTDPVLETYGDSLTAGFLSHTDVTHPPPLRTVSSTLSDLAMFKVTNNRKYIEPHHAPTQAWPAVVARKLAEKGTKLLVDNRAVSGARLHEVMGQVGGVKEERQETIAFFFAGHNDLCDNEDDPEAIAAYFTARLRNIVDAWAVKHRNSTAYLLPVADIHRVYSTLNRLAWFKGSQHNYTCNDSWEKLFPYCLSNARRLKAGTLDAYLVPRIEAVNRAIRKAADELTKTVGSNRVRFLDLTQEMAKPFEPGFFAIDCYHLSAEGQRLVGEKVAAAM